MSLLTTLALFETVLQMSILSRLFGPSKKERQRAALVLAGHETEEPRLAKPDRTKRYKWGEVSRTGWFNLGLHLTRHEGPPLLFIEIPWRTIVLHLPPSFMHLFKTERNCGMGDDYKYGFTLYQKESIILYWKSKAVFLNFPLVNYNFQKHEILDLQRNPVWVQDVSTKKKRKAVRDSPWQERHAEEDRVKGRPDVTMEIPYVYVLDSGTRQTGTAKVNIERRTWGRKWAPWWKLVRTCIDVKFSDEVGKRAGSWKGGTIGCGYELKPWETAEECFNRMMEERDF